MEVGEALMVNVGVVLVPFSVTDCDAYAGAGAFRLLSLINKAPVTGPETAGV